MNDSVPSVDIAGLAAALETGATLIDVREPDEFADARVPGAILVPLATVPDRVADLPSGPFYVICAAGGRSLKAATFLRQNGFDAVNVAGGTRAWVSAGRATASGAE